MDRAALFITATLCLIEVGCTSPNVNPPAPRASTGYVDFYTDSELGLSWEIKRAPESGGEMRKVFSEFNPVEGTVLRLAAAPGRYRFQVWFINRVTDGPQTVLVEVANGKVTPVHVSLVPVGVASVENTQYEYRPTAKATRRVSRTGAEDNQTFRIGAVAEMPQAYQPKERMPYSAVPPK